MEWLKTVRREQQDVIIVERDLEEEKDGDVANRIWKSEKALKCLISEDRKRTDAHLWSGTISWPADLKCGPKSCGNKLDWQI
jgi:hypothetical protein